MTQLETYISENENRFLEDLKGWLRIPSISTLPEHAGDIRRAAEYAAEQLRFIGFEQVQLIETQNHPLVYGEWLQAPGKPTVLVYGHYDVQPVDPVELWESPPFEPTIRGDNLYCRGACDDKGQTMLVFKALESLMTVNGALPVNVRVLIEGEEEAGGESIDRYVRTYPERLKCDAAFICDTHMPSKQIPALINGLRGIIYGTETEKAFWRDDPLHMNEAMREEMGVSELSGEKEYPPLERIWARPTLEVHGIVGGFTGEGAKTVIPAVGKAKISLRLPPDLKSDEVFTLFEKHVKEISPKDVKVTVHKVHGGEAVIVPVDTPPMQAAASALKEVFGREPVFIREGGSIPIAALFYEILNAPVVMMGFGLPDDNLHAPNEKYSLSQFYKGIRTVTRFLQKMGE